MLKPTLTVSPLDAKTRFRVQVKHAVAIGPGKADVLQAIAQTGSIAEAGRLLQMSYQRVWSLVTALNSDFVEPLVVKQRGGAAGGGAQLTPVGTQALAIYRAIERDAERAVSKRVPQLLALIRPGAGSETQAGSAQTASTRRRRVEATPTKLTSTKAAARGADAAPKRKSNLKAG